jgi:type II secretory pathway pseudopilin PulG
MEVVMETPQMTPKPQRGSVLNRPVHPLIGIIVLVIVVVFVVRFACTSDARYMEMRNKARMSTLRANLQIMRNAIAQFQDDTGRYPLVLTDLTQPDAQHLRTPVKKGSYHGPYLKCEFGINNTGLPLNPFTPRLGERYDPDPTHHWRYDPKTGQVRSAVAGCA